MSLHILIQYSMQDDSLGAMLVQERITSSQSVGNLHTTTMLCQHRSCQGGTALKRAKKA